MALPDYLDITQGTSIIFGETGASGVTHALPFNGLAPNTALMSAAADLGANYADEYLVFFRVETGSTAPTSGNSIELFLVSSYDNSFWPAKVTGTAGAYTLGTNDANLRQAGAPVSVLIATPDPNTVLEQQPVLWRPRGRYVVAIVDNNLGQALKAEGNAADNGSCVILVPRRVTINE